MAPCIETARIALRPLEPADATALLEMWSNEEVTRFLPFDAPRDLAGARRLLDERLLSQDAAWAICEGAGAELAGYIQVDGGDARDVGYALRRESWGRGLAREALGAVIAWVRERGLGFLTATHDVDNPRSGRVMAACGMTARYAYRERWLPKKPLVCFCMHQIDLAAGAPEYRGYWERWPEHWRVDGLDGRGCLDGRCPADGTRLDHPVFCSPAATPETVHRMR